MSLVQKEVLSKRKEGYQFFNQYTFPTTIASKNTQEKTHYR
jgi:hypothetical protein